MKAISIKQPWATLICTPREEIPTLGIKDIENRTWPCPKKYIGERVLIHASASMSFKCELTAYIDIKYLDKYILNPNEREKINDYTQLTRGAIIGSVEIIDCVINHPSVWAEKTDSVLYHANKPIHNWVLANPVLFDKPIPCKGKLSFWEFDESLLPEIH